MKLSPLALILSFLLLCRKRKVMENNEQNTDPNIEGCDWDKIAEERVKRLEALFSGCDTDEKFYKRAHELGYMTHEEFWTHIHKKIDEYYDKLGLP